jgi:nitrile hydratase
MHGFGPVVAEANEPVFHHSWEGRVFGLMITTGAAGLRTGLLRPAIEAIPAAEYLRSSYYERWLAAVETGLAASGTVTRDDIDGRAMEADDRRPAPTADPERAARLRAALQRPNDKLPPLTSGRFAAGDPVTVVRRSRPGHTRSPRYVRGVTGIVTAVHGGWPLPDDGPGAALETLYTVRFEQAALWGPDAEPGALYIDLWDSYLEPANP